MRSGSAVLGSPIAHSLSPVLHRAAYTAVGLDWDYELVECDVTALADTLDRLAEARAGVSLTMPLKRAVLDLVDECADDAACVGAANTVVFTDAGRRAHNTDIAGAAAALSELGAFQTPPAVALLGCGGTSRAVLAALARTPATTATVYARDVVKGHALVALGDQLGVAVVVEPWDRAAVGAPHADIVINTTPPGVTDELAINWRSDAAVFDVLYFPWPTQLARAATACGAPVVGGLPMLVAQAGEAFRLMSGRMAPLATMRAAGERALAARQDA